MISKLLLIELVTIQVKKQLLLNKGISNDVIDKLLQADPTNENKSDTDKVGSYTDWIVSRYLKDRTFNDFDKLHSLLELYDKSKHKIPDKELQNIGLFKTLNEFITYINNNLDKLVIKTDDFIVEEKNNYDMFYSRDFIIHVPHTKKLSVELGSGTKWCTSLINNNRFDSYYEQGYLFYITNKTTTLKKYNLFISMKYLNIEFADDKDRHLTYKLFDIVNKDNTLIPLIKNYFEYKNIEVKNVSLKFLNCKTVLDVVKFWTYYINGCADIYFEQDEETLLNNVNYAGYNIQFIPNPSIKIQELLLEQDIRNILYIESPDNTILKNLVSQNGLLIKQILNAGITPDYDVQMLLVSQNGNLIEYIIDAGIKPDHNMQMLLVSRTGHLIQYIPNPSEKVQLLLVLQDGHLIQHIINAGIIPKHLIQLLLVSQNGNLILYLIEADIRPIEHDVQLLLVSQNGYLILYIKYIEPPSEEVKMLLVSQTGHLIKYITNPSEEIQLLLVSQDEELIWFIKNPSEKVQLLLISQDPYLYKYIENPTPKLTLLYKQLKGIKESTGYISKLLDVN